MDYHFIFIKQMEPNAKKVTHYIEKFLLEGNKHYMKSES